MVNKLCFYINFDTNNIITLPLVTCADLSTLLQLLAHRYKDLDIRDRSRFYHQLLLTVSGEKVDLDAYIFTPILRTL